MPTSPPAVSSADSLKSLDVRLGDRSYPIAVGRGLLGDAGKFLERQGLKRRHAVIVSQKNIYERYGTPLATGLARSGVKPVEFIVPDARSSEAAKSYATYLKLIRFLASQDGEGKSLFVVALGGGVIGDLAGFAAAVYRRGVPFVQIPTTLTAQVDSAIGGKTAIDLPEGKNLLGTIYQPFAVLSDPAVLESLPERHWSDGFAEVIKYGVIDDPRLFAELERLGLDVLRTRPRDLERVIFTCAKIKARVVEKDELDKKGVRMVLNFGHTAGHGIEAAGGYAGRYTHGEAVAIGMLVACDIAQSMKVLKDASLTQRLEKTLIKFRLPLYFKGLSIDAVMTAIGYDKKSDLGKNRFILPEAVARMRIVRDVPASVIRAALDNRRQ